MHEQDHVAIRRWDAYLRAYKAWRTLTPPPDAPSHMERYRRMVAAKLVWQTTRIGRFGPP